MALQNEIFGDTIAFVGVGGTRREPRIITRQRTIHGGPATWDEIVEVMTGLGFRQLPSRIEGASRLRMNISGAGC